MERNLRERTKQFALRVIRLYSALPPKGATYVIGNQILRSGTSVGAHYREAQRAKSNADFVSKIEGALQELDETTYWLELLGESGMVKRVKLNSLNAEANELISILVTIVRRVKNNGSLKSSKLKAATS